MNYKDLRTIYRFAKKEPLDGLGGIHFTFNSEDMENLSYRELQAIAKSLSIPANLKREQLVERIVQTKMEASAAVDELDVKATVELIVEEIPVVESVEVVEVMVEEETVVEESVEESDEEEDQESDQAEASEDLVQDISKLTLAGIASPKGKKIVFSSPSPQATTAIKWNYEEHENDRIADENEAVSFNLQDQFAGASSNLKLSGIVTPKGKRTVFQSPDITLGNQVHWTIDEYENKIPAPATLPKKATHTTPSKTGVLTEWKSAGKKQAGDLKMSFWLAKGTPSKTPVK